MEVAQGRTLRDVLPHYFPKSNPTVTVEWRSVAPVVAATLQWSYCVESGDFGIHFLEALAINPFSCFCKSHVLILYASVFMAWQHCDESLIWFYAQKNTWLGFGTDGGLGLNPRFWPAAPLIDRRCSDETCSSWQRVSSSRLLPGFVAKRKAASPFVQLLHPPPNEKLMKVLLELRHFTCILENTDMICMKLQTTDMLELETVFYLMSWQCCAYALVRLRHKNSLVSVRKGSCFGQKYLR